jgi:hypothetical protein
MAPWEELVLACNLKSDVPQQVEEILIYLISSLLDEPVIDLESISIPDHYFFTERDEFFWRDLLGGSTYYFPGRPYGNLTYSRGLDAYSFTMRTMVRHGENLVKAFLDWLAPYCETQGFVGYTRCDEIPDVIDLIHFDDGTVYYNSVLLYKNPPVVERIKITKNDSEVNNS